MRFPPGNAGRAAFCALAVLAGCGGEDASSSSSSSESPVPPATSGTATQAKAQPQRPRKPHREKHAPKPKPKPKRPAVPPGVAAALHAYVDALDAHDGDALCGLFEPGALDTLRLPAGTGCEGLSQSIGFDPPHGLPQWRDARVAGIKSAVDQGGGVRVTVTIVDRYVGNPQPSIEDDVVFLRRSGGDWLIRQPSVTIYRAIATPNPPPSVLAAPSGG